jgi:hypothetical protein
MRSKGGRGAMPSEGADATGVKVQRVEKSKSQKVNGTKSDAIADVRTLFISL